MCNPFKVSSPNQQDSKPEPAKKQRGEERTYPLQSPKAVEKEAAEVEAQVWEMTWIVTNSSRFFTLQADRWTITEFYTSSIMVHHPDPSRAPTSTNAEYLAA